MHLCVDFVSPFYYYGQNLVCVVIIPNFSTIENQLYFLQTNYTIRHLLICNNLSKKYIRNNTIIYRILEVNYDLIILPLLNKR